MSTAKKDIKKVTTHQLQEMKTRGEKISMLTAYDYSFAKILDDAVASFASTSCNCKLARG